MIELVAEHHNKDNINVVGSEETIIELVHGVDILNDLDDVDNGTPCHAECLGGMHIELNTEVRRVFDW